MSQAGRLNQTVTLQSRTTVQDAAGHDTITWTDIATVRAEVRALSAREFFAAAQTQMEQTIKVRIRYRSDVDMTCRLVWQGRNHDITGVIPIGRNDVLELLCLQGVKDGR